ncbi:hypothetical protein [Phenylobacterium sp.]|uniref:hypothetical protein n=1 Tax=Phenylobacterium sp. TaxID=1871053 RepID=UPI002631FAFB|nr:hypothetical protein [Phenylobacterium sp.]
MIRHFERIVIFGGNMTPKAYKIAVVISAAMGMAAPSAASAQLGLRNMIPGAQTSGAAATNPDAFLAETIETTKYMMIAAAVLARAAESDGDRDALRAEIAAIQGISDIGELNAQKASFAANTEAAALNYQDAEATQAKYDAATTEQQQLLLTAAYNFALGMARNSQLASQSSTLLQSMMGNPMLLSRVGSIRTAGSLLAMQAKAAHSMGGPLRTLMSRGGVQPPTDASAEKPKPVLL